jgi:hypothetical protein
MFRLHGALSLAALTLGVRAQVSIPFDQYITGLGDMLKNNGMNILSNAIGSVNGSETGAALLEALYRGVGFTLFGPVDAVSACMPSWGSPRDTGLSSRHGLVWISLMSRMTTLRVFSRITYVPYHSISPSCRNLKISRAEL